MLAVFLVINFALQVYGQSTKTVQRSNQMPVVDDFDGQPSGINCSSFHGETAIKSLGYCIYYEKAEVTLSKVAVSEQDSALRIEFNLPPYFDWGNWLSIRNEPGTLWDLSEYKGLELKLRVEAPSNAMLRLTLADVVSTEDVGKKGSDELWWFDFHESVMKINPGEWQTLKAPFKKFYESWGAGTRHNDSKLDLSKIVAFEISMISPSKLNTSGRIVLNTISAYR